MDDDAIGATIKSERLTTKLSCGQAAKGVDRRLQRLVWLFLGCIHHLTPFNETGKLRPTFGSYQRPFCNSSMQRRFRRDR